MKTKFTRGNWLIKPIEDDKEYIRIRGSVLGGRFKIANVNDLKFNHDCAEWCRREREESMANAHLIATAPEMYELLSDIKDSIAEYELRHEIEKLLAKARGEV